MEVIILTKIRVYELAKELNISTKELIDKLNQLDIKVKNHMSTLEDDEAKVIYSLLTEKSDSPSKTDVKSEQKNESDNDLLVDEYDDVKYKSKPKKNKKIKNKDIKEEKSEDIKILTIPSYITVKELSEKLRVSAAEIIKKLFMKGKVVTLNHELDFETASNIAEEYGILVEQEKEEDIVEKLINDYPDSPTDLIPRDPVVTVMGHVDHGKTSLLDAIRKTNVTAKEAGGITQHIGASVVEYNGKKIVFLDTPGHEAFTAMRARGAKVTDIVVLVVAADDGVMPQTIEAINHVKAANVPIIVAINKIDKPTANPERVKMQLSEYGLIPEEWGGDTIFVEVSALKKIGIDSLLEMILIVAELQDLKANPNRMAKGTVIEAQLDKGRGPVATVLIQNGTLNIGDAIVAGKVYGKVRAMMDDKGKRIKKAGPSTPVEIIGFSEVPEAGDILYVVKDEKTAKEISEIRKARFKEDILRTNQRISLDDLFEKIKEGNIKELNIIIKADVHGSVEAIKQSLEKISTEEVRIKVIHSAVGAITETDIMLASASNAIVIGFNVRPDAKAKAMAEREKVDIRLYRIIYDAIEDIKRAIKGVLEPVYKESILGHAEVRAVFKISGVGTVAGCMVQEGKILRSSLARLIRDGIVIYEGKIASLKRFKDDVREVTAGYECGIGLEKFNDIKEGDIIESYIMEKVEE